MKKNTRKSQTVKTAKAKPDCAPRTCSATGTLSYLGKIEEDIARELRAAGYNVIVVKHDPNQRPPQIKITIPKRKKKGR